MAIPKALIANFDDLFTGKENAVICYLSLERRYIALNKRYSHLTRPRCNKCDEFLDECRAGHSQE